MLKPTEKERKKGVEKATKQYLDVQKLLYNEHMDIPPEKESMMADTLDERYTFRTMIAKNFLQILSQSRSNQAIKQNHAQI